MSISTQDRNAQRLSESILEKMTKSSYTITIEDAIDDPTLLEISKQLGNILIEPVNECESKPF